MLHPTPETAERRRRTVSLQNLNRKLCLVQGKDHVALQQSRGGENDEFSGKWAGIGRIRFTFLSGDVISRQGETKAKQCECEDREGRTEGERKGGWKDPVVM